MSREQDYADDVIIDEEATDVYIVKIIDGVGHIFHANDRRKGNITTKRKGIPLGEILMMLRAPLLEDGCEASMDEFDKLPEAVRLLVQIYGLRALRLWQQGFDVHYIKKEFGGV